jgi:hypothetical protein
LIQKVAQTVFKAKKGSNIFNKAKFESPKHLHQTTFRTAYLGENVINLLGQNVAILGATSSFQKNYKDPP